ncbi:hypothetical protein ACVWW6_001335 [Bradyrhizobium sp. USDA 3311]
MIAEILDKAFVLEQLRFVRDSLRSGRRRNEEEPPPVDVDETALQSAADAIDAALAFDESASPEAQATGRRRDPAVPVSDIESRAFISSDPVLSIAQSALERYFEHKNAVAADPPMAARRGGGTSADPVTGNRIDRRIFDKFSITDPGWVSSLIAMGVQKFRNPHVFNQTPAQSVEMKERCRLVIVGDWGSGLPRARATADAMRTFIDACLADGTDCHVIHLGDVYYSGWDWEYRKRFLPYWPVHAGEEARIGSWCLNGNHDMYSGGYGYYDTLLADRRFGRQERSSFFRLFNKDWQILGLDTAYDDDGLRDPQGKWVLDTLAANSQKTMLLTHHQFFSAFENAARVGAVLRAKLKEPLAAGRVDAAIWGHEHRCVAYSEYGGIRYPRLVGHGGVPVYMTHAEGEAYPVPAIFEDRRFISYNGSVLPEKWAYMGFAVMDFDGPELTTRYVDENGLVLKEERFS